jgi:hypothetical protein
MQNAKCKMQNAKCKMQNVECRMHNAKCKMQNDDHTAESSCRTGVPRRHPPARPIVVPRRPVVTHRSTPSSPTDPPIVVRRGEAFALLPPTSSPDGSHVPANDDAGGMRCECFAPTPARWMPHTSTTAHRPGPRRPPPIVPAHGARRPSSRPTAPAAHRPGPRRPPPIVPAHGARRPSSRPTAPAAHRPGPRRPPSDARRPLHSAHPRRFSSPSAPI